MYCNRHIALLDFHLSVHFSIAIISGSVPAMAATEVSSPAAVNGHTVRSGGTETTRYKCHGH